MERLVLSFAFESVTMRHSALSTQQSALIQDITDFIPIFHREPTISEVAAWAQDFYSVPSPSKRWIQKLITIATTPCHREEQSDVAIS